MLEPGILFWTDRDDLATIRAFGVKMGQMGVPGGMTLDEGTAAQWKRALEEAAIKIVTLVAAYEGEDYADVPTVQRTVGFMPRDTRKARETRTLAVSDFAARLGVASIACHIGFVPEDPSDADYLAVRDLVRRICDHAAQHGQTFALETGQERAEVLLDFICDVDRPNLRINFDPANLILYGTGEPIDALRVLGPLVVSVHCKDGDWPPNDQPDALGSERPLGKGAVGVERFVQTLGEIGYRGPLIVEREAKDQSERLKDIGEAVTLLRSLTVA